MSWSNVMFVVIWRIVSCLILSIHLASLCIEMLSTEPLFWPDTVRGHIHMWPLACDRPWVIVISCFIIRTPSTLTFSNRSMPRCHRGIMIWPDVTGYTSDRGSFSNWFDFHMMALESSGGSWSHSMGGGERGDLSRWQNIVYEFGLWTWDILWK